MLTFQDLVYFIECVEFLNRVVYSTELGVYTTGPEGCMTVQDRLLHIPACFTMSLCLFLLWADVIEAMLFIVYALTLWQP